MSAQSELADLLALSGRLWNQRHSVSEAGAYCRRLGEFMNAYGPAVAELIEAVSAERQCENALRGNWRAGSAADRKAYDKIQCERLEALELKRAALAKLTEPKA